MKSPLKKLRGFALHGRHDSKERREHHNPPAKQDELVQASQDMQDMRNCYDSLLSAAASTANSAYEFSEALREMGTCLLEKTALDDDEDNDRVLLMLGKTQFELQKLVDSYRTHIIQTITTPSESLLKELHTVEEMKHQCDDKRDLYKFMLAAHREKGRSRNVKGENFSSQQLQAAQEDYEEEANLFVFRLKSLKQGQSRSLLTQAARHHAAQLNFFRKGLKSLEVVEPHVKVIAEQQHIDYQFSGLEDDETEDDDDDDDDGYEGNDDGELSFDYGQNDQGQGLISMSRNSMELDEGDHTFAKPSTIECTPEESERIEAELIGFSKGPSGGSQSAPICAEKKFDPSAKLKEMRPSSTRKFHTYVLPTPVDAKSSASAGFRSSVSAGRLETKDGFPKQFWHSSPIEPHQFVKGSRDDELPSRIRVVKTKSVLKESNIDSGPVRIPPPLEQFNSRKGDAKKLKTYAFSGPITSESWSAKPLYRPSVEYTPAGRFSSARPSVSPRVSPNASPPPMSSPKINELHELPRPPVSLARHTRPSSLIGHSAPLARGQELRMTSKMLTAASHRASPLPTPPAAMARSFSIPSSSQRMPMLTVAKLLESSHNPDMYGEVSSPPLAPISLKTNHPASTISESDTQATKV